MPPSAAEMADGPWFNMWRKQYWPINELNIDAVLYWYESAEKSIVWRTIVEDVDRFSYDSKEEAKRKIKKRFGEIDDKQSYYTEAPSQGFCLVFKVKSLQRLNLPKPDEFKFPQQGWLSGEHEIAQKWLEMEIADDSTLDEIIPDGIPIERLRQLNNVMAGIPSARIKKIVSQTIRNDTILVKALKDLCHFSCQFPNCNVRIPKKDGGYYIEVAHIEPVSEGGRSVLGNLLVLCPNHHKEFDYGDLEIIEQTIDYLHGKLNGEEFEISLPSA
ncbi:HNH endonuclease [Candidatus Methanoperedens nitratireducens]|uniref:HNH endonuclease n=1 Tax=Candidatus Methanoperedens nitratireducens TaxID=1392998 RepID=UPI001C53F0BB|nr:HNH endonuclease [Candidatus Methanoperedens nitroreducens]